MNGVLVDSNPLPDFFIGAHAEISGLTLITRDSARYNTYFPTVTVISPKDNEETSSEVIDARETK